MYAVVVVALLLFFFSSASPAFSGEAALRLILVPMGQNMCRSIDGDFFFWWHVYKRGSRAKPAISFVVLYCVDRLIWSIQ